jgi:hypothetical protein
MLLDSMRYPGKKKESEDDVSSLKVLGATIAYDKGDLSFTTVMGKSKAENDSKYIAQHLGDGSMPPGAAKELASRVQAAVTISQNKEVRACGNTLDRQVYDPRPAITPLSQAALLWWTHDIEVRPPSKASFRLGRKEVILWSSASGESRTLGVVTAVKDVGSWSYAYTYLRVPDEFWELLLDRLDKQTDHHELLAVTLVMTTRAVQSYVVTNDVDNDGVLGSILKGASKCHEVRLGIASC